MENGLLVIGEVCSNAAEDEEKFEAARSAALEMITFIGENFNTISIEVIILALFITQMSILDSLLLVSTSHLN